MQKRTMKTEMVMLAVPAETLLEAGIFEGDPMQMYEPQQTPPNKPKEKNNGGGTALQSVPPSRRKPQNMPQPQEVKSDGQA